MKKIMVGAMVVGLLGMTMGIAFTAGNMQRMQDARPRPASFSPAPLAGTITHLTQPGSADGDGFIHFTLATPSGVKYVLIGPAHQLAELGLTLANGDRVVVSGSYLRHERNALIARDMTIHNTTYSLRTPEAQ